eukprot:CAMPEP_0172460756 /NCGR_PEP_ID=MMETSP1065-20121228/38136_1 /TAXON_ID=265537 /ORGANISM="Amphiprora paludosa, Strain CCMP125" /LENGTH=64 /DNA_ID=CAMNT_0013215885 /DNA_START=21 /DNA_END=211 /DNA_ORIENTATION=+
MMNRPSYVARGRAPFRWKQVWPYVSGVIVLASVAGLLQQSLTLIQDTSARQLDQHVAALQATST